MTILLSGSTGFLGCNLKCRLQKDGHSLDFIGRKNDWKAMEGRKYDAIINCAAELDECHLMYKANVELTFKLLEFARNNGEPKFIQIGSSSETGPMEGMRYEDSYCNPSNLYEATKLAATNLCLGYARDYDMDVSVARPSSLYGPNDKPRKFIPSLCRAVKRGDVFCLFPGGHDWLFVDDFVNGIVTLLETERGITQGQIYHFGTEISTANSEISKLFAKISGIQPHFKYYYSKYRDYDVLDWRVSNSKAFKYLKWIPKINLAEGLKTTILSSQ